MAKLPSKSSAKEVAKRNTNVTHTKSGKAEVLKEGKPLDHSEKQFPRDGGVDRVGMNMGLTKNMDNYESLRIDAWYSTDVQEGETVEEAYDRIREVLDEVIGEAVTEYTE